jgi:hypothetical protein
MPEPSQAGGFDLTRFSEGTRRRLYDRISEIVFAPPGTGTTPDQAGLQVVFFAGRWFATWLAVEETPDLPDRLRIRLVRIVTPRNEPAEIELYET